MQCRQPGGHEVLRAMRRAPWFHLPVVRGCQPSRTQILWAVRHLARSGGFPGVGRPDALCAGFPAPRDRQHSSRRNQTSYRPLLRHRQLDPPHRAARSRGDARPRAGLSRGEPGRGAPLWRHGATIHRRRVHGPVRGAAHPGRPRKARVIGGSCRTAGAPRRRRGGRSRALRADGANWHPHGSGRVRPCRRQVVDGLHSHRRYGQCSRPASASRRAGNDPPERSDVLVGARLCACRAGRTAHSQRQGRTDLGFSLDRRVAPPPGCASRRRLVPRFLSIARASSRS